MHRREVIAIAAGGLLAGCTSTTTERGTATTSRQDATETTRERPETRLKVRSALEDELKFSFRLENLATEEVVSDKTETISPNGFVRMDDAFSPGEDYLFTILRDGAEIFDLEIYSCEGYVLTISSKDEVEITRHVEI